MRQALRVTLRMFLFTCLSLGSWTLAAQDSSPQTAPDNTKVNERDKNSAEPTADQQRNNRSEPGHHSPDSPIDRQR